MQGNYLIAAAVFMPMAAAIISYIIGRFDKRIRDYFAWMVTGIELAILVSFLIGHINGGLITELSIPGFAYMGLDFTLDGFRVVYGTIAAFMWFISTLFSREYFAHYRNRNRYYLFLLITLGATEGVFLSADLYTTFIFFEIMSFTSYVWVGHDEREESLRAAATYLAVAVIGGLVMLMGLFLVYNAVGTLRISELLESVRAYDGSPKVLYIAGVLMAFGFGAKAGAFPLHIWLPKAHPVAPAPASALLSGILTKAGMFGILVITSNIFLGDNAWGTFILLIGVGTMVIGALLALFSIDLKRTLACSSVSQIGFILVGVGMQGLLAEENALAVRGSLLHMVNHSLIKLALFCAAGVVYMNLHKLDLNEIRGFGRKKPLLNFIFLMGALGIGGVPLWNGYISKTLIHEAIVEYTELLEEGHVLPGLLSAGIMKGIEWSFLVSGGLTVAYMTKLYICLFIEKNADENKQKLFDENKKYMNSVSAIALGTAALALPILGFGANVVMNGIADLGQGFMQLEGEVERINYYSFGNLKGGLISICIGILIYLIIVRPLLMTKNDSNKEIYVNRWPKWLDLEDYVYRPILLFILPAIGGFCSRIADSLVDTIAVAIRKTVLKDSPLPYEPDEGTAITHALGLWANKIEAEFNKVFRKNKKKHEIDYEHELVLRHEAYAENRVLISRSMSFGLLLFCVGLLVTLGYLVSLAK